MANTPDLEAQLQADLVEAMKARDEVKLQVLRLLKAALKNYSIEVKADLSPQQMMQVLQKEAKKRQDSITQFREAGRMDLVDQEERELKFLSPYLPEQPTEAEITAAVQKAIQELNLSGMSAMGQVIAAVKQDLGDTVDGATVSRLAREALA